MRVLTEIRWDTQKTARALHDRCTQAAEQLGKAVLADCGCYVPYATGALAASGHTVRQKDSCSGVVVWNRPYAQALYYGDRRGIRLSRKFHPHASFYWFEAAKSTCLDAWRRDAAREIGGVVR